jgi:hypothetical protein
MIIISGDYKWKVQSTTMQPAGTRVGMTIVPFNIHIMRRTEMDHVPYNERVNPPETEAKP